MSIDDINHFTNDKLSFELDYDRINQKFNMGKIKIVINLKDLIIA